MADNTTDSHYEELDRLAARSLAAREGAAVANGQGKGSRQIWPWVISGLLFAFALGLVGSPLFEREVRSTLPATLRAAPAPATDPRVDGLVDRVERLEAREMRPAAVPQVPGDAAALGLRLQAIESRAVAAETNDANMLARLDALAAEVARTRNAAAQTDARTRDLFLLSVARRMVEAGRPLTPIEGAIADRFRTGDSAAVEALAAWSAAPQTRRTLAARLEMVEVAAPAAPGSWWDRLKARLSGLVTVRGREPATADKGALLAQARAAMASGDLGLAVSALGEGDWPPPVQQWVADARILMAAEEALGRLETNALETGIGALQAPAAP